jgi:hypothetical protein
MVIRMSSSLFERRLLVLNKIQEARLRLADAHIALGGRAPTRDERFKIEALEIHLSELGDLMGELDAGVDTTVGQHRERVTIQQINDSGDWTDVATVWANVEVLPRTNNQICEKSNVKVFTHSPDYRTVKLGENILALTTREAQLIEILHDYYKRGTPEVGAEHILDRIASGKRVRDIFATKRRHIFRELVRPGQQKGTFRLNLD